MLKYKDGNHLNIKKDNLVPDILVTTPQLFRGANNFKKLQEIIKALSS
jgi:hypothetical protein